MNYRSTYFDKSFPGQICLKSFHLLLRLSFFRRLVDEATPVPEDSSSEEEEEDDGEEGVAQPGNANKKQKTG